MWRKDEGIPNMKMRNMKMRTHFPCTLWYEAYKVGLLFMHIPDPTGGIRNNMIGNLEKLKRKDKSTTMFKPVVLVCRVVIFLVIFEIGLEVTVYYTVEKRIYFEKK